MRWLRHATPERGREPGVHELRELSPARVTAAKQLGWHAAVLRRIKATTGGGHHRIQLREELLGPGGLIRKVQSEGEARHGKGEQARRRTCATLLEHGQERS